MTILPRADWSAFPHGYSLLLNEKAQFPQDLSSWRTKIDHTRQLFADTHMIARSTNLRRRLHPVDKHPANPLVKDLWAVYVHPEIGGGYRLYGNGWRGRLDGKQEPISADSAHARQRGVPTVYMARSTDGLEWDVSRDPVLARTDPTSAWEPLRGQLHGLLFEPEEPDPEQRWKLIMRDRMRPNPPAGTGLFSGPAAYVSLYTSPDGLRWLWNADTTLLRKGSATFEHTSPMDGFPEGLGDVLQVRHDAALGRYIAHTKHTVRPDNRFQMLVHGQDGPVGSYEARVAGWAESDDLIHWSAPRIYAYPDAEDARIPGMYGIYEASGFRYESMWLGCLSMTANVPDPSCAATPRHAGGYKKNWIRLAGSRDGRHWYYLADREDFIPNGAHDSWDAHYLRMAERTTVAGPVVRDDELWFYYHGQYGGIPGCPGLTQPKSQWQCGLGLGIARRDGFVSLEAGQEPGEVITRPLVFTGTGALCVNVQAEDGGAVQAAVLEEDGTPIPGLEYGACAPLRGDAIRAPVSWTAAESLPRMRGRYVRFAFRLESARIYSFWVE